MRCPHCPAPPSEVCRGEAVPHFCRLVDPADLNRLEFVRILVRDDVILTELPDPLAAAHRAAGTGPSRGGCCH